MPAVPSPLRAIAGWLVIVGSLTVTGLGVLYAGQRNPGGLDGWAIDRPPARAPWEQLAEAVNRCGSPLGAVVGVAATAALCLRLRRPATALLLVGVPATVLVTSVLKHVVGRRIYGDQLAFPSGHTGFATALALVLAVLVVDVRGLTGRRATLVLLGAATAAGAAMGWAKVTLHHHYPTDTVGGYASALAVVPLTALILELGLRRIRD